MAPLQNSGLVPSTASVPFHIYAAFITYIQLVITHVVDMSYISTSWRLNNSKTETRNEHIAGPSWESIVQTVYVFNTNSTDITPD